MKNVLIIITATLFIFGCGEKKEPEKNKLNAAVDTTGVLQVQKDDAPPSMVNLTYKFAKGTNLAYRLTSQSNNSQSLISDSTIRQSMKQSISYIFNMDVIDVDEDKVMDMKMTITSVKVDADANGKKFSYQSGSKLDSLDKLRYIEYESIVNNPFYMRLDPKGNILEVYRVDKIANKFFKLQGIQDSVSADQKKQFQTNLAETALKPLLQQLFRIIPSKDVGKDSIWTNQYPARLGVFDITNTAKYKLKEFAKLNDDHVVLIDAGLDIVSKGQSKVTDRGVNYDFSKPVADGSGTIYFNVDKGRIEKSKTRTSLKMTLKMDIPQSPRGPMKATRNDLVENINILEIL